MDLKRTFGVIPVRYPRASFAVLSFTLLFLQVTLSNFTDIISPGLSSLFYWLMMPVTVVGFNLFVIIQLNYITEPGSDLAIAEERDALVKLIKSSQNLNWVEKKILITQTRRRFTLAQQRRRRSWSASLRSLIRFNFRHPLF